MIVLGHQAGVLQVTGDVDSLYRFHDVYQTTIWPTWRDHLDTCKQLRLEQGYVRDSVRTGQLLLNDCRETHSGIEAAIADAKSIMTVIQ